MKIMDLSKINKSVLATVKNLKASVGFKDPSTWIHTGNYALNYRISGDFFKGFPLEGKMILLAGESGCLPESGLVDVQWYSKEDKERAFLPRHVLTIAELKKLYQSNEYNIEIDTPDGFKAITQWFDKGKLQLVELKTEEFSTKCAYNHLLQIIKNDELCWEIADNIEVGDIVLTKNGNQKVISKKYLTEENCYDFTIDSPEHRYWGDGFSSHNSGKSFLASGNVVKWCQDNDILPFIIDTENALDESWVRNFGIDPNNNIVKVSVSLIDDIGKIMADFLKMYKDETDGVPYEEKQKVLFIIDSLGMAITPTESDQFEKGDMKGDMGRKQKQLYSLCRNFISSCASEPIGLLCTQHTYASQDMFNPDMKIAGGCLVAGTKVLMADDKYKNIENINVGDVVQTFDSNHSVQETFKFEGEKNKHCFEIELSNGQIIRCTDEHKFAVQSCLENSLKDTENRFVWATVNTLNINDTILVTNGEPLTITRKTDIGNQDVYDINVEGVHSYLLENNVISHNSGLEFTPSIIVALQKRKLKEDEEGNKTTEVKGIKVSAVVRKTRYTQPFQKIDFNIPWDTGMNPYSGLFDLFESGIKIDGKPVLSKSGNQYVYKNPNTGEEVFKKFRKNITNQDYDNIMMDYKVWSEKNEAKEKEELLNTEVEE